MNRIYINFGDLNEEKQNEILQLAIEEIENDEEQIKEINNIWPDNVDEIVRERAERALYSFDYIFNV